MKKYTEKDLEAFERDEQGWLICPSGNYTAIRVFPAKCSFDSWCTFGAWSNFGDICNFGENCNFGEDCSFGMGSSFGVGSSFGRGSIFDQESNFGAGSNFGKRSAFDNGCSFGAWSSFGERSTFGEGSSFGVCCSFGEWSRFGEKCSHEGLTNSIYVAIDRIGSELRKTYFFKAEEGYFVRAGFFFGTLDEFKAQVHKTHRGTIHETTYRMACELAVKLLDSQWK